MRMHVRRQGYGRRPCTYESSFLLTSTTVRKKTTGTRRCGGESTVETDNGEYGETTEGRMERQPTDKEKMKWEGERGYGGGKRGDLVSRMEEERGKGD